MLEDEELAEAVPESDKTLRVVIPCGEVDTLYFDRPYYLTPDGEAAETAFAVIRAGLAKRKAAAIARAVLFRRLRAVLIRAQGTGLVADTLEFDHEVRDAAKVFDYTAETGDTRPSMVHCRSLGLRGTSSGQARFRSRFG